MSWFMHHAVLLGLVGAGAAVAYGLYLTVAAPAARPATSGCGRSPAPSRRAPRRI